MTEFTEIMMTQKWSRFGQRTLALVVLAAFTCRGLSSVDPSPGLGDCGEQSVTAFGFHRIWVSNIIQTPHGPRD